MICITIAQSSRRFALADMFNAARQCDLLELRLDRFAKAPDVGDMLSAAPKPVIMSCRRQQDGGEWQGKDDERLALLRQCIISKADYVEIELDVADQIRKYPPSKRIISYTNFQETPADIADVYTQALTKSPDVIKLATRVRTPEEAWPLIQILAKPAVPTVVIGLGKAATMLSVLAKKINAPWTYAALEHGMEVYPGQPTVNDLQEIYHLESIERSTSLVGVTGFTERERAMIAALNAAFISLGLNNRCLPLEVGNAHLFRKIIDAVRLTAVLVDQGHQEAMLEVAQTLDSDAQQVRGADLIVRREKSWQAHYVLGQAALKALEATVRGDGTAERPLAGRHVMIVGANPIGRALAFQAARAGALPIVASRDRDAAHAVAKEIEGRFVPFEALYTTMHEVLVVCSEERQPAGKVHADEPAIHPAHLQPHLVVMDLTSMPARSPLLRAAAERGCRIVSPRRVFLTHMLLAARLILGRDVPVEPLKEVIRNMSNDDE